MKTQHTSGPWIVNHGNGMHHVTDANNTVIAEVYHNTPTPQPYHNTRLIAAAPELLEALQSFTEAVDFIIANERELDSDRIKVYKSIQRSPVYFKAKEVIAKATAN